MMSLDLVTSLSRIRKFVIESTCFIFFIYLILPFAFFTADVDISKTALASGDGYLHGFPSKLFASTFSLWNPYLQSGRFSIPAIPDQSAYLPGLLILRAFPNPFGYNLFLLLHYTFAGFFTYLFCRSIKLNRISSFMGGLIFMFSGYFCAHKDHHAMVSASIWLPLILYFFEKNILTKRLIFLFFSSISFSFCILADYWAIPVYTAMVAFPYLSFRIWNNQQHEKIRSCRKLIKIVLTTLIIFGGGLLLSAVEAIPVIESLRFVTREKITLDFFTQYSFPFIALPLLFFPNLFGSFTSTIYTINYFGPWNPAEITGYIGIIPLCFSFLAFTVFRQKDRQIWFWCLVAFFGFILVLGNSTPLYEYLFYVPIYNKFRAPARNWFEVSFALSVLSAFFINYFLAADPSSLKSFKRKQTILIVWIVLITIFILGSLALIHLVSPFFDFDHLNKIAIFPGNYTYSSTQTIKLLLENTKLTSPAIYLPLTIISLSIIFLILLSKCQKKTFYWVALAGFIFLDLFSFGHFFTNLYPDYSFLNNKDGMTVYKFIHNSEPNIRTLRILALDDYHYGQLWPNSNMYFDIQVPNAYGPIWLKDYAKLTTFLSSGYCHKKDALLQTNSLFSLLSIKYILTRDPKRNKYIESIMGRTEANKPELILDGSSLVGWELWQPFFQNENTVTLKSPDETGTQASLMQYLLEVQKNHWYKISLEARTPIRSDKLLLAVDLAGYPKYDLYYSPETAAFYTSSDIDKEFTRITASFFPRDSITEKAYLRIYTFKSVPVEIKNVRLEKVFPATYWGRKDHGDRERPKYQKRHQTVDGIAVYENMNFLPRACFVQHLAPVRNFQEANNILWGDIDFNPSNTALVEGLSSSVSVDPGEVLEADYSKNDSLTFIVKSGNSSFLVLSDSWYPGWRAYIDQKETRIYRTNGVFRGIFVEGEGKHKINFIFKPKSFYWGCLVTLITLLIMGGFSLIDLRKHAKGFKKDL